MPPDHFTVMRSYQQRAELKSLGCPSTVPWALVAPFAERALANHHQTLERLNERGGLSPRELALLLQDEPLWPRIDNLLLAYAVRVLKDAVAGMEGND